VKVVRYNDVEAFYARVEAYLLPNEASHNLTFGLLSTVRNDPARFPEAIFALVEDAGAVMLVALRTNPERALILSLAAAPEAITLLAQDLHSTRLDLLSVTGPNAESKAFAETWARLIQQRYWVYMPLRTYKLEKVIPVTGVSGHLRRATVEDRDRLVEWDLAFRREAFPKEEHTLDEAISFIDTVLRFEMRGVYVWDDGGAVSYACYGGPTPHGIRIGPVYTPPQLRGRGYASACVAGMSQALLDSGRQFCFLFTDLNNPTSNHIYQVIGYESICDLTEYSFSAS
jgi:predicted GNAT family acetyltransferase